MRSASLLIVVALGIGCGDKKTVTVPNAVGSGTEAAAGGAERLDLIQLKKDYASNRPGTIARFVGKTVEVDVAGLTVGNGDAKGLVVWIKFAGEDEGKFKGLGVGYIGHFSFADNPQIKTIRDGVYAGKVRGLVRSLEPGVANESVNVVLDPAMVVGELKLLHAAKPD